MTISIEQAHQFIHDVDKRRENFTPAANRAWDEIKKRNRQNRLKGGQDLDRLRRWMHYPLWWTTFKVRQPIALAHLPQGVVVDTLDLSGKDIVGQCACSCAERLLHSILKTFDAMPVFTSARDDFLITNFGWARPFYRQTTVEEELRIAVQRVEIPAAEPQEPDEAQQSQGQEQQEQAQGQEPAPQIVFVTEDGRMVDPSVVKEDDLGGYYAPTGKMVEVESEEVYLAQGLWRDLYVDPDAVHWSEVKRLAFASDYSYRAFREKFGEQALQTLALTDISELEEYKAGKPIRVFEYWDWYDKECLWFAENSNDFFQPRLMASNELKQIEKPDNSDLYGLSRFFPVAEPLRVNAPTDEYWPIPEYFQVKDLIDNIHSIVSRLIQLTRAMRVRFLMDGSVPELKSLIQDTGEAQGIQVPNLSQILLNGGKEGSLAALVAWFPIGEIVENLSNMYKAFQQGLDMYYQATGMNDLLRGQTSDSTDKTFGERQMEGKYALNRVDELQQQIQQWIKRNYELLVELALKSFSDKTLDEYIVPETLDESHREHYATAIDLLKNNRRSRFRVDFETDSTIAINQEYRRKEATDFANAATKMIESVAKVAETQPEIAEVELTIAKHVVAQFAEGKLFLDEITEALEGAIQQIANKPKDNFNSDQARAQIDQARLQLDQAKLQLEGEHNQTQLELDDRFRSMELNAKTQIEIAKIQAQNRRDALDSQIAQLELQIKNNESQQKLQATVADIQAKIAQGWEDLNIKKETLLLEAKKVGGDQALEQFRLAIESRIAQQEQYLSQSEHKLEQQIHLLNAQERIATETRLQAEHHVDIAKAIIDAHQKQQDMVGKVAEQQIETVKAALEAKKLAQEVHAAQQETKAQPEKEPAKKKKRSYKIKRNKAGDLVGIEES